MRRSRIRYQTVTNDTNIQQSFADLLRTDERVRLFSLYDCDKFVSMLFFSLSVVFPTIFPRIMRKINVSRLAAAHF